MQNGGGMSLLADRLGYVRLAEPVRFHAAWERAASLRLRDGDASVLEEYDRHARISGGEPELVTEAAAADYTALAASDSDALLIAADHALRRELSRRVRENLIRLGLVDDTRTAAIAGGAAAGRGDLIMCTANDHRLEAGEPGRTLANGDLLRIDAITADGLLVRRAVGADRETGRRRWTDRQFLYANFADAELGYAVTAHVAQGRTVRVGLAVFNGSEDRQHAYVALTRGTHQNTAYVFTTPTKLADPAPGARPAPELARYDRLTAQNGDPAPDPDDPGTTSPVSVLAEMITSRDGAAQSASQAWSQALADADHLAVLHAIWDAETTPARQRRYRALLQSALPAGAGPQESHREQWLHRTLHAAELAGLDAGEVLTRAVAQRDLIGIRDIPAAIDARIRQRHGDLIPLPAPAWSDQVPETADPERSRFLTQLAAVMDDRRRRIGEHAAASSLPWAVAALGAPPEDHAALLAWQSKAAAIGAYREVSGHDHPDDPIGPEPATSNPDLRAAWHEARAALTPGHARDVRHLTDDQPQHLPGKLTGRPAERHDMTISAENPGFDAGPRYPLGIVPRRTAILQPPEARDPAVILGHGTSRQPRPGLGGLRLTPPRNRAASREQNQILRIERSRAPRGTAERTSSAPFPSLPAGPCAPAAPATDVTGKGQDGHRLGWPRREAGSRGCRPR